MFSNGVYILSYALLVLAIAILIFARRQFWPQILIKF
jgi:hypothetical protein